MTALQDDRQLPSGASGWVCHSGAGFLEHLRFSFKSLSGTSEHGALRKDSSLTFEKAFNIDHSRGGREGAD